jgi:hypothetical protein
MEVNVNPGLKAAPLPNLPNDPKISEHPKKESALFLVAAMMAENYKMVKKAAPDRSEAQAAMIEHAICQAFASEHVSYADQVAFWKSMKDNLPQGSPLLRLATSNYNLLVNDPTLKADEQKVVNDAKNMKHDADKLKQIEEGIKWTKWMLWVDPFFGGGALAGLEAAKFAYEAKLKSAAHDFVVDGKAVVARQNVLCQEVDNSTSISAQGAGLVIDKAQTADTLNQTQLEQMDQMGKVFDQFNEVNA